MPRGRKEDEENAQPSGAAARSFWSGTITFGLVSIPVDFYAAARSRQKSMKMVDSEGKPLGRRYYGSSGDKPLAKDEMVRGYETESGKMVVISDEEFDSAAPEESRDIELSRFVPFEQVPPLHYDRPYFLAPAGRSAKAYTLLAQTMERADKAGIGRLVMRGHEYLVAIIAEKGVLRAETLRHADELRTPENVGLPDPAKPSKKQVTALAKAIDALAQPHLDPDELEDREAERLHELAREKHSRHQDVVQIGGAEEEDGEPAGGGKVVDLMQLLRKSLGAGKGAGAGATGSAKGTNRDNDDKQDKPDESGKDDKPVRATAARKTGTTRKAAAAGTGKGASAGASAGAGARAHAAGGDEDVAQASKARLYDMAAELGVEGRSKMSKDELVKAVGQARKRA